MPILKVAAWNVQNLFEVGVVDRGPQSKVELDAKIERLSIVIQKFFGGKGPDLLGLCEIQTESLLVNLASKLGDQFLHQWVAPAKQVHTGLGLLFRRELFRKVEVLGEYRPTLMARPRVAVFHCELEGVNEPFLLAMNHWKSRMRHGNFDPGADRLETARWFSDMIEAQDKIPTLISLGDFNAEPNENVFGLTGMRVERFFKNTLHWSNRPTHLYSPMWRFNSEPDFWEVAQEPGYKESRPKTSFAGSNSLFDHIMVSSRILKGGPLKLREKSVGYFYEGIDWTNTGLLRPVRWLYDESAGVWEGASDHFPLVAEFDI